MKVLKIAGVSILALGLVLGMVVPALATPGSASPPANDTPPKVLAGKVISLDEGETPFVIQSRGQEFTISVNGDTQYFKVPAPQKGITTAQNRRGLRQQARGKPESVRQLPRFREEATLDDITIGARVVIWLVPEEDNPVAKLVLIIKPITPKTVTGTISGISSEDKTITIVPADGSDDITLNYNERTRFILRGTTALEEGQSARIVLNKEMTAKVVLAPIGAPELAD